MSSTSRHFPELPRLASFAAQQSQGLACHTFSVVLSYRSIKRFFNGFIREGKKTNKHKGYQFKETRRVLLVRGENSRAEGKGIALY
jgi:hypothetical protein